MTRTRTILLGLLGTCTGLGLISLLGLMLKFGTRYDRALIVVISCTMSVVLIVGCVLLVLEGVRIRKRQCTDVHTAPLSLHASLPMTVLVISMTAVLIFLASYAWHVNDWAFFTVVPLLVLLGVPLAVAAGWILKRSTQRTAALCIALPVWLVAWMYLARPNGIWVAMHRSPARASFEFPEDARSINHTSPSRQGSARFQVSCISTQTLETLSALYSNRITRAGYSITSIKEESTRRTHPVYEPSVWIQYQYGQRAYCVVAIYDNAPELKGLPCRFIRQECNFVGPFLNPPVFSL